MTIFQRESPLTGQINERDIAITIDQWELFKFDTRVIQQVFPWLSDSDREFLLSGYTDQDWEAVFGDHEEEEEPLDEEQAF